MSLAVGKIRPVWENTDENPLKILSVSPIFNIFLHKYLHVYVPLTI